MTNFTDYTSILGQLYLTVLFSYLNRLPDDTRELLGKNFA